jgi:transposase-like protein
MTALSARFVRKSRKLTLICDVLNYGQRDNNIVEQDHRAIKRIIRSMLAFKSMCCARILLAGIEMMHMIRKGQLRGPKGKVASAAKQFYSVAF